MVKFIGDIEYRDGGVLYCLSIMDKRDKQKIREDSIIKIGLNVLGWYCLYGDNRYSRYMEKPIFINLLKQELNKINNLELLLEYIEGLYKGVSGENDPLRII